MMGADVKTLLWLVADADEKPLTEADLDLFGRLVEALGIYDYHRRHGCEPSERLCQKCGVPVSECCC